MDNQMNSFPTGDAPKESKGAMIGTIIIVILLVIGGLFVLSNRRESNPDLNQGMPVPGSDVDEMVVNEQTNVQSNDSAAIMEAELNAEIEAMEAEMQSLEAELGRF